MAKRIGGKVLERLESKIRTEPQAKLAKKQLQSAGWKYVAIRKETNGYAIYGKEPKSTKMLDTVSWGSMRTKGSRASSPKRR